MYNCCQRTCFVFLRLLFLIFNSILFLLGLLMLGFGIALYVSPSSIFSLSKGSPELTSLLDFMAGKTLTGVGIFMIVLGCVVTFIALVGFIACLGQFKVLLVIYVIIIILIMLAEIIIIIMLAGFPNKVKQFASSTVKLIDNYEDDIQLFPNRSLQEPSKEMARKWAIVQTQLSCCGINGPADYGSVPSDQRLIYVGDSTKQPSLVPLSCCSIFHDPDNSIPTATQLKQCANLKEFESEYINSKGCFDSVQDLLVAYWQIPIGIAAATIGLQLVLTILSIALLCTINRLE